MGINQGNLRNYFNRIGVKSSVAVTVLGICMLTIALIGLRINNDAMQTLCVFSLFVGLVYGVIVSFKLIRKREEFIHLVPFLILNWFIGCFCTNVLINIFENLPVWVYVLTFLFCFSNFFIYSNFKNKWIIPISFFINGITILLIIYYAIYLMPLTFYSLVGILALGLGFYGLVPFIVLVIHTFRLVTVLPKNKSNIISFSSGIILTILSFVAFTIQLNKESEKIRSHSISKTFETNADLPTYIIVSQSLKPNFFNEILLKKDLVYTSTENFFDSQQFRFFSAKQYNERKSHNPFVNVAYFYTKDSGLSVDDRINILKSNFDKRLETEEQLWSGDDLITKNIKEDVKIYPNERLAYTEITMDIAIEEMTWNPKEAIYSFQLPEGSVATSLSLWVNGVERKGILTTKEKAQKAYTQIVGVEARDPSLMQWREGNRVVVRVFPVSYDLPRTFKCGFTTPLKVENNKLKYQSLNIKGPNISNAETLSRLQISGNEKFDSDKNFELKNNFYINESRGLDKWETFLPIGNSTYSSSFIWKDNVYEINPIESGNISFIPSEIVLDLDSNWSLEEIKKIINLKKNKFVVIINNKKEEINSANYETVFTQFENLQYSLLPLYILSENSLIITKSGSYSANFEELQASEFLNKIKSGTKQKQLKAINISSEINPFWQTIKEQKYVEFIQTDLENALKLVKNNQFLSLTTDENRVNIETAGISIHKKEKLEKLSSNGSNHIYRMYAFGKVLEEQVTIQNDSLAVNKYVTLAQDANIVTPITSLIVLETDEDYTKHGIEKNIDTLGNASINNDGAVPEPHEWVLIILTLVVLFVYYKKCKKQSV